MVWRDQVQAQLGHEVGKLLQAKHNLLVGELQSFFQYSVVIGKSDISPEFLRLRPLDEFSDRYSFLVTLLPLVPLTVGDDLQPLSTSVHYGNAHTVKPTTDLVRTTAELSTGAHLGKEDFQGRLFLLRVLVNRDSTTVVLDRDTAIIVNNHPDVTREATDCLIHTVIQDLLHKVMQAF